MPARLLVTRGLTDGKEYPLEPGKTYAVGRSRDADIVVKDQRASRHHCSIECTPEGQWTVTDNHSSNGTYVNRQRIESRPLRDGDVLQVGHATFEFHPEEAPASAPAPQAQPAKPPPAEPAPPEPEAPPSEPAKPEPPPAQPAPAPSEEQRVEKEEQEGEEDLDQELQGLFDFLDRIDSKPAPSSEPSEKEKKEDEPKDTPEGGGLLDFLRKKKKQD